MQKNFDDWNKRKKEVHARRREVYASEREVWWCTVGVNVGAETDGTGERFDRPVLVLRVYNQETLLVVPITSKEKRDQFHQSIQVPFGIVWAKLTQMRVISTHRLLRKVDTISKQEFEQVKRAVKRFI